MKDIRHLRSVVQSPVAPSTAPDPTCLDRGTTLFGRYCIIGDRQTQKGSEEWSLLVTDLEREHGPAPTHHVQLYFVPESQLPASVWEAAKASGSVVQPNIYQRVDTPKGSFVFAEVRGGKPLARTLRSTEAFALAQTLTAVLYRLERAGVASVDFDPSDIVVANHEYRLAGFRHLTRANHPKAENARALMAFLRNLSPFAFEKFLTPEPRDSRELFLRFNEIGTERGEDWSRVLPPDAPFVGRNRVLHRAYDALAQARLARPRFLVLRGGRGVGKTRLLAQLAADLRRGGSALVVESAFSMGPGDLPPALPGAFDRLAREASSLSSLEGEAMKSRIRRATAPLTGVLDRFSSAFTGWTGDDGPVPVIDLNEDFQRQAQVGSASLAQVGTQRRPLVLLLDNLERADAGAVALLQALMERGASHHTLVVAAAREAIPQDLEDAVDALDVDQLDTSEIRELLHRSLPGTVADADNVAQELQQCSQGNALAAWANLQDWIQNGWLYRQSPNDPWALASQTVAPKGVTDLFAVRLGRLSPDATYLAYLAALRGRATNRSWITEVTHWEPAEVQAVTDELLRAAVLLEEGSGDFRFVHDTVRDLVLERAPEAMVVELHGRITEWLRRQPNLSPSELAHHWELSSEKGPNRELAEAHLEAGDALLAIYDLERAEWHFEHAEERAVDSAQRAECKRGLGDTAILRGDPERAVTRYLESIESAEDPARRVLLGSRAVYSLICKAGDREAMIIADRVLALEKKSFSRKGPGLLFALLRAAFSLLFRRRPSGSEEYRDALCQFYTRLNTVLLSQPPALLVSVLRGAFLAKRLQSPGAATALGFFGVVLSGLGKQEKAERVFDEAEGAGADHLWSSAAVRHMRGHCLELPYGQYEAGQRSLDHAVAKFASTGDMSIAVLSFFFKSLYGRDREPSSLLLKWLDSALAEAENHKNTLAVQPIAALRLVVLARAKPGPRILEELRVQTVDVMRVSDQLILPDRILSRVLLASGFREMGQPAEAMRLAREARQMLNDGPTIEAVLETYTVLVELLLDEAQHNRSGSAEAKRNLRKLKKAGRQSTRLRVAHDYLLGRCFRVEGKINEAAAMFEKVISERPIHGEIYWAMRAHKDMAEMVVSDQLRGAVDHYEEAKKLSGLLYRDSMASSEKSSASIRAHGSPVLEGEESVVAIAHPDYRTRVTIRSSLEDQGFRVVEAFSPHDVPESARKVFAFGGWKAEYEKQLGKGTVVAVVNRIDAIKQSEAALKVPFTADELAALVETIATEEPPG
ncbi:MAG: AAA family ATPase [Myxococcales bacterium]|nr:AAA family ATPase [Myxococcales bacterium]